MIKESKFIIRRIIIGVGIALCLAFLNGCKVKALGGNVNFTSSTNKQNYYLNNSDYKQLCRYNRGLSQYPQLDYYVFIDANNENIIFANTLYSAIVPLNQNAFSESGIDSMLCLNSTTNNGSFYNGGQGLWFINKNSIDKIYMLNTNVPYSFRILFNNSSSSPIFAELHFTQSDGQPDVYFNDVLNAGSYRDFSAGNDITNINDYISYTSYDIYENSNSNVIFKDSNTMISSPEFVSFHQTTISNNNLIMGYNFSPEFSVFDTDNYVYQYKFGENSTTWLSLTENEQNIRVNANGTIYVRIKDLANNNIIDSATFTITDIGQFYDSNIDYKITFNGEYRTENFLNDNVSSSPSVIKEYVINVDYSPKSSILTYQYQYVLENNSIDNNNWQTLGSSNNGSFGYVASQNGVLYARILDAESNVLTTSTFTVNAIGKLALDSYNPQFENFFTKLSNKINYGGPISAIFRLPVNFLSKFYDKAKINACTPYKLSTLLGTDFYLPCIDLKSYIGDTYYHMFDIMLCIMFTVNLIKFLYIIYNKFVSLEEVD